MEKIDQFERANILWPILTELAKNNKINTYKEINVISGIYFHALSFTLDPIQ